MSEIYKFRMRVAPYDPSVCWGEDATPIGGTEVRKRFVSTVQGIYSAVMESDLGGSDSLRELAEDFHGGSANVLQFKMLLSRHMDYDLFPHVKLQTSAKDFVAIEKAKRRSSSVGWADPARRSLPRTAPPPLSRTRGSRSRRSMTS